MASIPSLANPKILKWARKTAHMQLSVAAKKVSVDEDRLKRWEDDSNDDRPTLAQLKTISKVYKRPLAVFFLSKKPEDFDVIRDFRTTANSGDKFSSKLIFEIRYAQQRQSWASEYRRELGEPILDFVGSVEIGDNVVKTGARIRKLLGVSISEQNAWYEKYTALRNWVSMCEDLGLMVFQTGSVDVDEMRGFAITDDLAPAVMINAKDAPRARIFTLLHELVHVFLGESGVSSIAVSLAKKTSDAKTEIFCNAVAGEILVPTKDFRRRMASHEGYSVEEKLTIFSRFYTVSKEVIARRMLTLGAISRREYNLLRASFNKDRRPIRQKGPIKIPRATMVVRNNGKSFSRMAISAYRADRIAGNYMSSLLNMKMNHFGNVEAALYPSRIM